MRLNIFEVLHKTIKFGTGSRFKGLSSLYITATIECLFVFLSIHILSGIKTNHSQSTYDFISIVLVSFLATALYPSIFRMVKQVNMVTTKFLLIIFCYVNLALAFMPTNLDNLFKHVKHGIK